MTSFALICLISSIIVYTIYIGYIYSKYQPDCISRSYYLLKNGNLFTVWILLVSFLIFPAWVEISPIYFQFLPFLSVVALSIVGICPKYLESDRNIHIISAGITSCLSLLWNIVSGIYIIPTVLGIVLIILYCTPLKNKFFWTECLSFINIYLSIFIC